MNDNIIDRFLSTASRALIVIAALVICALPLFYPVAGNDGWIHLNWLSQFPKLFAEGNLYPRWMPDLVSGYGSPAFYFYPPFVYWSAGVLRCCGVASPLALYQSLTFLCTVASGLSCYILLRQYTKNTQASFFGALVYCIFPYRFADMYLRNALSEHAAFIFIPLVLLALVWVGTEQNIRRTKIILASAIGWAGLLCTNIPTFIIVSYGVVVYSIATGLYRKQFRASIAAFIGGSLLALAISAVYILPAIANAGAISMSVAIHNKGALDPLMQSGYAIIDLFHPYKKETLNAILVCVIALGCWMIFLNREFVFSKKKESLLLKGFFWIVIAALFFQIPYLSQPLWTILYAMPLTQFSWRWDIWLTLIAALLYSINTEVVTKRRQINLLIILCASMTIVFAAYFHSRARFSASESKPNAARAMEAPEYLPKFISIRADSLYPILMLHQDDDEIQVSSGSVELTTVTCEQMTTLFTATVRSSQAELLFHRMYFPTWHLRDDRGVEYQVYGDSLGRIIGSLPQGTRSYKLEIVPTNIEEIGKWLSVAGLVCLFGVGLFTVISRKRGASSS